MFHPTFGIVSEYDSVIIQAMRRTNEHLQNRLPEDGLTILEFEDLINSLNRAMRNLKVAMAANICRP